MSKKFIYGKAHDDKWPHVKKVLDLFQDFERKFFPGKIDPAFVNILLDLRNEVIHIIDEAYQELAVHIKHNLSISPSRRKSPLLAQFPQETPCEICGESRVINKSHIIPREVGGSDAENNVVILCANHHYLFDQARLTQEEFIKIDVSRKAADTIEYFNKVRREKQAFGNYRTMGSSSRCGV